MLKTRSEQQIKAMLIQDAIDTYEIKIQSIPTQLGYHKTSRSIIDLWVAEKAERVGTKDTTAPHYIMLSLAKDDTFEQDILLFTEHIEEYYDIHIAYRENIHDYCAPNDTIAVFSANEGAFFIFFIRHAEGVCQIINVEKQITVTRKQLICS